MSEDAKTYIPAFYSHRSVFITGGTGFLGKALCEKLLRSCPDIKEIFLLIRPNKGLTIKDRLTKMLNNKIFDTLRNERLSSLDKLVPINGDITAKDLGLSADDRKLLIDKVSIIFHVAATVRFDESLRDAIFSNLRSTRDVCILAESMRNLVSLLHVSSAYTQSDKPVVDEVLYPLDVDWRQTIQIAEFVNEEILNIFTAKYMGTLANTYVFTKRLAEQVIDDYSKSLPCSIIRPSIVVSSVKDPVAGFIDNFNGPVGLLVGGGVGLLRVLQADSSIIADFVPVDVTIKAMLIVCWKRGIQNISENESVHVYNCSASNMRSVSMGQMIQIGFRAAYSIPLNRILWKPSTSVISSQSLHYILVLMWHILPALFIDFILKIIGVRPMLLKLQRKVYVSNSALSFFLVNTWHFNNTNLIQAFENLSAENEKNFGFKDILTIDIEDYFRHSILGTKIFLLNEDINRLEQAKRHRKRIDWLYEITRMLFVTILCYIFYSRFF